ncbi:MAG: N-acetylmuramoyl-L-alanine amidase [Actinomycetota bacterium]
MQLIKRGSRGSEVVDIQTRLIKLGYDLGPTGVDGIFGKYTERAVKEFQQDRGLLTDGIVGEDTWRELVEATYRLGDRLLYLRSPFLRGDDVKQLQRWLNTLGFNAGPVDGIFGPLTEKAVREFQENVGLVSDGIVGPSTLGAFQNFKRILKSNEHADFPVREEEPPTSRGIISIFKGRRIAVDFGHGYPPDPGAVGPTGLKESEVCEDLGLRFGNLLDLLGAKVIYTRKKGEFVGLSQRANLANDFKAELFISFHVNGSTDPKAEGSSTYYFASGNHFSKRGKKLAQVIQEELVSSLERKDGRIHGKNFLVLRETRMPAVLVEPVYITNPEEEKILREEVFRQKIAVAVFDGLKRYFEA